MRNVPEQGWYDAEHADTEISDSQVGQQHVDVISHFTMAGDDEQNEQVSYKQAKNINLSSPTIDIYDTGLINLFGVNRNKLRNKLRLRSLRSAWELTKIGTWKRIKPEMICRQIHDFR